MSNILSGERALFKYLRVPKSLFMNLSIEEMTAVEVPEEYIAALERCIRQKIEMEKRSNSAKIIRPPSSYAPTNQARSQSTLRTIRRNDY